jgi:hypothetical protein
MSILHYTPAGQVLGRFIEDYLLILDITSRHQGKIRSQLVLSGGMHAGVIDKMVESAGSVKSGRPSLFLGKT